MTPTGLGEKGLRVMVFIVSEDLSRFHHGCGILMKFWFPRSTLIGSLRIYTHQPSNINETSQQSSPHKSQPPSSNHPKPQHPKPCVKYNGFWSVSHVSLRYRGIYGSLLHKSLHGVSCHDGKLENGRGECFHDSQEKYQSQNKIDMQ